jgi:tripartite-type tricarboxylate transporter receptor subunit TctC
MREELGMAVVSIMRSCLPGVLMALACAVSALAAYGQAYPAKPVRFVSPMTPGGTNDLLARSIAKKLTEQLGRSVVVENRPGAGGNLGTEFVAKSPGDGYTLLMAPLSSMVINVTLYGDKLPFDPLRDFAPITLVAKVPLVIVVSPAVSARTLAALITLAKTSPRKLNYGSAGTGTSNHLTGELFKTAAGIDIEHIPYKGFGPAFTALMGGEIDMVTAQIPSIKAYVESGRVYALATSGAKRSPALPNVPTMIESGLQDAEATSWYSVVTSAGTPRPVIDRLHAELVKAINSTEVRERLLAEGADVETSTPEELAAFLKAEITKWARVVKASGARLD